MQHQKDKNKTHTGPRDMGGEGRTTSLMCYTLPLGEKLIGVGGLSSEWRAFFSLSKNDTPPLNHANSPQGRWFGRMDMVSDGPSTWEKIGCNFFFNWGSDTQFLQGLRDRH